MADEIDISRADLSRDEQATLLRTSVERWNAWRRTHPEIRPDLIEANLHEANLHEADLTRADLSGAILIDADLIRANLSRASLID
jgi:uncharacterized protein YjbI with pentapeptide repeats